VQVIAFVLIGIGTGALYAMVAQGLVLVYRGSGVVNFAHGAFVMFGAYVYYEFAEHLHLGLWVAVAVSVACTATLGATIQLLILRPMRRSSALSRLIATLGVLIAVQAAAVLLFGDSVLFAPRVLSANGVEILPGARVGEDRLIIFLVGLVLTIALWGVYRFSNFGRITTAVAQNPRTAASMGHSPDLIALANWSVGGALAGLAGCFIGPITSLEPVNLPLIVLPALAAALIGGFSSFPLAFVAAELIGVAEALMARYVTTPGLAESVPFLAVILVLIVRGRGLPLRSYLLDRLPSVGTGRVRVVPVAVASLAMAATIMFWASADLDAYLAVTITMAIMCLSIVVVTGYAGQISLAQYVLGGVGAFGAAKAASSYHAPFLLAILIGAVLAVVVGGIVGIPALRSRGINLAIVGLGMAVAVYDLVLNNDRYSGGLDGIVVQSPSIFGWNIDPLAHPARYAMVCLVALVLVALIVANLRRGRVGRRLLAVRSSERAAASLGVSVYWCKLYAFMVAAAIAAIGGALFAFTQSVIITSEFSVTPSVNLVTVTVVGGVGDIPGAILGATLVAGGVGTRLLNMIDLQVWLPLIGGLMVLYVLRTDQDGLAAMNVKLIREAWHKVRPKRAATAAVSAPRRSEAAPGAVTRTRPIRMPAQALEVDNVAVRYGGVHALDGVSLTVEPGTVHGVIGPNGAGKTTLVDAITGFASLGGGSVRLNDVDVSRWSPLRRSRAGLRRSFQSVELFAHLTARENIAVGCDDGRRRNYLTDLVRPGKVQLSDEARMAGSSFRLDSVLDSPIESLPFGDRRLVAIARAVASGPSVLLLDEPAAGLSDREAAELADLVRSLAHDWGIAVLLIEHNIDMVLSVCDTVTVLVEGKVLASGTAEEIRGNAGVLAAYLGGDADRLDVDTFVAETLTTDKAGRS
jgi:ABC-type branched-subunit amino acid transport system ATPase component/branched-subunit amino acid ABC-type transport system permease component